mmetsp:Transcript_30857/g.63943  ORF Transcript_30857/g.63943 Transcript_30857/m.63943 type:complete len:82 (-) Transcript_30857:38-283(-)
MPGSDALVVGHNTPSKEKHRIMTRHRIMIMKRSCVQSSTRKRQKNPILHTPTNSARMQALYVTTVSGAARTLCATRRSGNL